MRRISHNSWDTTIRASLTLSAFRIQNDQANRYAYSIGIPTPLQTKKIPPPPSWGEGALVPKPHSVHENSRRD